MCNLSTKMLMNYFSVNKMTFIELIFRYLKGSNLPAACAFMGFILSMFYFMSVYSEVILDKNIYLYY